MFTIISGIILVFFILVFGACLELVFNAASGGIFILAAILYLVWRRWMKKKKDDNITINVEK